MEENGTKKENSQMDLFLRLLSDLLINNEDDIIQIDDDDDGEEQSASLRSLIKSFAGLMGEREIPIDVIEESNWTSQKIKFRVKKKKGAEKKMNNVEFKKALIRSIGDYYNTVEQYGEDDRVPYDLMNQFMNKNLKRYNRKVKITKVKKHGHINYEIMKEDNKKRRREDDREKNEKNGEKKRVVIETISVDEKKEVN